MAIKNWPSKINWAQFTELDIRPPGATTDAHIEVEYRNPPGKQFGITQVGKHYRLTDVNLVLKTIPGETWVVKGKQNKELLKHEQGHWDILGLVAREYQRKLRGLRAASVDQLRTRVQTLEARMLEKGEKFNSGTGGYDTETNHGRIRPQQKRWDALIASCIKTRKNLPGK
jgi:predicted secreted Zn-dependent protease